MSDATVLEILRRLQAQLAPGPMNINTLVQSGIAGHIHANFDRVHGGQNVDTTNTAKRTARLVRPGAIILPNLDLDDNPGAPRARWDYTQADAVADAVINDYDDDSDVTFFTIEQPTIVLGNATRVSLRVDPADAQRIRILRIPDGQGPRGPGVVEVIGPAAGNTHVIWNVPNQLPYAAARYMVESLTIPGDPDVNLAPPAGAAPPPPGRFRSPQPATSGGSESHPAVNATNTAQPAYGNRIPGDVWVQVVHERAGGEPPELQDYGLFTIAPWIMTWNTLPCERVYVAYLLAGARAIPAVPTMNQAMQEENHSMVWELMHGCHAAGLGAAPPVNTSLAIPTHQWDDIQNENDVPFFIVDQNIHGGDRWVQDEFEIGYCWGPHHWLHIALHTPRSTGPNPGLWDFVQRSMAHPRLGVLDSVSAAVAAAAGAGTRDFGGNLEVSPPVPNPTPAMPRNPAGPALKAHRAAPLGKIILGDCTPRAASPEHHDFLVAQRVQPVLALDTSWLSVAHVDEFLSFVRATGPRGFKLLIASVRLMTILLREVLAVEPAATIHPGKYRVLPGVEYDETFVADWVTAGSARRNYSERVDREKLSHLRNRLKAGLELTEEYVLSIPTYWEEPPDLVSQLGHGNNKTIAENVGMVNMLVVNDHLMVPRPHGPRLLPAQAATVVHNAVNQWFGASSAPNVADPATLGPHHFWARPGETVNQIAGYFAAPPVGVLGATRRIWRQEVMDAVQGYIGWGTMTPSQTGVLDPIRLHVRGQLPGGVVNDTFPEWQRITVNDGRVDVIELYMKTILEDIGNTVHFVENFESYHAMMGEVHCGTNAKRRPPEADPAFTARWWDPGVYDPDYDTTYNPAL